jgi:hypothetical protein
VTTLPSAADARLATAISRVRDEIARTDTKGGVLLTALGLPLAAIVATVPGHHVSPTAAALLGIGALGLLTAMLVVLLVVRPRITGAPRGTYLYWAYCTTEQVLEDLHDDTGVEDLIRLSRLARTKFRALKAAIDITVAALIALAAALLAT